MDSWHVAELHSLLVIIGIGVRYGEKGRIILTDGLSSLQVDLGRYTLPFLYTWLGLGKIECPGYGNVSIFHDDRKVTRTVSVQQLRTCYTGILPFATSFSGPVVRQIRTLAESPCAFYISFPEEQLTGQMLHIVCGRGWSWNVQGGLAFVSNSLGAAIGLPPNPRALCIPAYTATFYSWSARTGNKDPGHRHTPPKALRLSEQVEEPAEKFFDLTRFISKGNTPWLKRVRKERIAWRSRLMSICSHEGGL